MKVATFSVGLQPGKYKYQSASFDKLVEKFSPKKASPFIIECIGEDFDKADVIIFDPAKKFDFVFIDLDKIDRRLQRTESEQENALLRKAQQHLEKETFLNAVTFSEEEQDLLKPLAFVTRKPCAGITNIDDISGTIEAILQASGTLLFFTANKNEVRAWDLKNGETAVDAAGRIHSDFARGFIKAEIVNCNRLDDFYNIAEARAKGLVAVVDRDYVVESGDIIEIKFNV